MSTKFSAAFLPVMVLTLSLAACSTYRPPAMELPAAEAPAAAELNEWWQSFGDATLTALIDEALAHNADVRTAMENVEQSKAALRQANLTLLPDVSANLSATRQRASDYTAPPGQAGIRNIYSGGFNASYEIDLWGRSWNARSAVAAQLLASRYARETTRTSVAAQTARSYFELLALDAELEVLKQTQDTRQQALDLQNRRYQAGVSGDYELQLDQSALAAVAARLPAVLAAREQVEGSLALLLGRSPKEVFTGQTMRDATLERLAQTPEIPAGLPADLLARRPDVRRAEADLAAADASLQETRRRYFPSLSLTGFFGGESTTLSTLTDSAARSWSAAGLVTQPIVGLLKTGAQVKAAKSVRMQAEIAYGQAASAAYADTRSALASHRAAREVLLANGQRRDYATRIKSITEMRYERGAASYLDVLNAERDRLTAENDYVQSLQDRLDALVNVYTALGGGWNADELLR